MAARAGTPSRRERDPQLADEREVTEHHLGACRGDGGRFSVARVRASGAGKRSQEGPSRSRGRASIARPVVVDRCVCVCYGARPVVVVRRAAAGWWWCVCVCVLKGTMARCRGTGRTRRRVRARVDGTAMMVGGGRARRPDDDCSLGVEQRQEQSDRALKPAAFIVFASVIVKTTFAFSESHSIEIDAHTRSGRPRQVHATGAAQQSNRSATEARQTDDDDSNHDSTKKKRDSKPRWFFKTTRFKTTVQTHTIQFKSTIETHDDSKRTIQTEDSKTTIQTRSAARRRTARSRLA